MGALALVALGLVICLTGHIIIGSLIVLATVALTAWAEGGR